MPPSQTAVVPAPGAVSPGAVSPGEVKDSGDAPVQVFEKAVAHIKNAKGDAAATSTDDKLQFYALYKQATDGDCNGAEPSRFKVVAHSKWSAWKSMEGMSKEDAMKLYVKKLSSIDTAFAAEITQKKATAATEVVIAADAAEEVQSEGKDGMSTFAMSILLCLGVAGFGLTGFLLSTLSTPALFFLALFGGGILGMFGAVAFQLDTYGIIGWFSDVFQRVLLEKSLYEVLAEGVLMRAVKENFQEILPILIAQTEEARLQALQNMRPETRLRLTRKGVVNILPEWQKRLILPRQGYATAAFKAPRYCPPLDSRPSQGSRIVPKTNGMTSEFNLKEQARVTRQIIRRLLRSKNFGFILSTVNPRQVKALAIGLAMALYLQIKSSKTSRNLAVYILRILAITGSALGSLSCVGLAFAHRIAKRELAIMEIEEKRKPTDFQ